MPAREAIETLALLLAAGLLSELVAGILRVPRMLVLLGAGALLGPSVLDVLDVPLDSVGVEVLLTLGVSFILFHGGLGLSLGVLRPVAVGLGLLAVPGVLVSALGRSSSPSSCSRRRSRGSPAGWASTRPRPVGRAPLYDQG